MTLTNNFSTAAIFRAPLGKRMLIGAAIGLVLIIIFLSGTGGGKPEFGKFWMARPLIFVPVAGALGALFFHIVNSFGFQQPAIKALMVILGSIGFIVALWMGTVLGLVGTYWH
ncbi:hypothetical protein ACS5PU_10900 [Pedobacter sp. GSP4]|uniref:hypothetical protein n=1 Tax=Pedobacter sp. GSP4 TaxID=3453716 RepID=UPI003EEE6F37